MQVLMLRVHGGNSHRLRHDRLAALQDLVASLGAETSPAFLRVGPHRDVTLQPVNAAAMLKELEIARGKLGLYLIPSVQFLGEDGRLLGAVYPNTDGRPAGESAELGLWAASGGIRLTTAAFPPPVGFRSHPALPKGVHECYFERLEPTADGWRGYRAPGMGGTGAPVRLPDVPIPLPTRWDLALTAGKPAIAALTYAEVPAPEVFSDLLHAFESACTESLRLKQPVQIWSE